MAWHGIGAIYLPTAKSLVYYKQSYLHVPGQFFDVYHDFLLFILIYDWERKEYARQAKK